MLKISLFNQGSCDKEKSTSSREKLTENKIKNHNDNPANIQVNCLFPQHEKPKKTTTGATFGNPIRATQVPHSRCVPQHDNQKILVPLGNKKLVKN